MGIYRNDAGSAEKGMYDLTSGTIPCFHCGIPIPPGAVGVCWLGRGADIFLHAHCALTLAANVNKDAIRASIKRDEEIF